MTDAVANVGAVSSGAAVKAVAATPVVSSQSTNSTPIKTLVQLQPISPVLTSDSVTGALVTQYLSSTGQVETQFPSKAALAYLRQGLTPTGERKDQTVA